MRLLEVAKQVLVSIDQGAQVIVIGAAYILHLTRHCPSADETISSYVGRAEVRGAAWAKVVAPLIDGLFVLLGEEPGHCRRNIETAARGKAPTP